MFGRRKTVPQGPGAGDITVTNGTGDPCTLTTQWDTVPDANWWRDFCRSARHMSDGDMSTILATLQHSIDGQSAHMMTTHSSVNNDMLGRLSRLELAQTVSDPDTPPEIADIACCWAVQPGAERHLGKIILELRELDPDAVDWQARQESELEVADFITQLTDEGVEQISSIFAQYDNGVGLKQGLAIEALFTAAGRALFARNLGPDEASTQQLGCLVTKWQVTAIGSVMVNMQLRKLHGTAVH